MEHAANLVADFCTGTDAPRGFAAGTLLETGDGPVDVAGLRPGQTLCDAAGRSRLITGLVISADTDLWVSLPSGTTGAPLIVAAGQLLACRHFICAALFGTREALFSAGNMESPKISRPGGERRRFFLPVTDEPLALSVGGYEFHCFPATGSQGRGDGWRASSDTTPQGGGRAPRHGGGVLARALLSPAETQQLCDSGVLFRQGGRR